MAARQLRRVVAANGILDILHGATLVSRGHGPLDRIRAARDAARQREAARVAAEESSLHGLADEAFAEAIPAIVHSLGQDAALRLARDRLARRRGPHRFWEQCVRRCDRLRLELRYEAIELGRIVIVTVWWAMYHRFLSAVLVCAVFGILVGLIAP